MADKLSTILATTRTLTTQRAVEAHIRAHFPPAAPLSPQSVECLTAIARETPYKRIRTIVAGRLNASGAPVKGPRFYSPSDSAYMLCSRSYVDPVTGDAICDALHPDATVGETLGAKPHYRWFPTDDNGAVVTIVKGVDYGPYLREVVAVDPDKGRVRYCYSGTQNACTTCRNWPNDVATVSVWHYAQKN